MSTKTEHPDMQKHLAAAKAARARMNGYSDEQRAELDQQARTRIQGGRRGRAVCRHEKIAL